MMELILSRHGETLENQQHILQGQLPGTLSPLGIRSREVGPGVYVVDFLMFPACRDNIEFHHHFFLDF